MTRDRVINRVKTAFEMWEDEWCVGDWSEEHEALDIAIAVLERYQWTPVSKKKPEKEGRYWVWAEKSFVPDHVNEPNRYQGSAEADFMGGRWYGRNVEKVIAWMPIPEPYTEEEK